MNEDDALSSLDFRAAAEAVARQNAIDREEAGQKAPHGALLYRGVQLDSRWDVLSEYTSMRAIVDRLPDLMRVRLTSIWCDSKCPDNYVVAIRPGRLVPDLPVAFEAAVVAVRGGHNGIVLQSGASDSDIMLDCNWGPRNE